MRVNRLEESKMGIQEETDPAKRNPHQHLVERVDALESILICVLRTLTKDDLASLKEALNRREQGLDQSSLDEALNELLSSRNLLGRLR